MGKIYLTTHEASKYCRVFPTTVINWINVGMLPAFTTPGGHRRIKRDDLINLMNKNKMPVPQELLKGDESRILVIDDDKKIVNMIKTILEAEKNFKVITTNNGFEAGVIVAEWLPDIILLDILMPNIDGFQVCKKLRQIDKIKDIPIIAITVLKSKEEIEKMLASGFNDYLSKPFKSKSLIDKIRANVNT